MGSLRLLQRVYEVNTAFIIILRCYLSFSLCWYLHWSYKRNDKIACTLVNIKAMTSNCIFHHYTHAIKRKSVLSEPVKDTNFIKFWSLSTFKKIFYVIMERMHTALLLLIMLAVLSNSTCVIVWVATWIWHLFMDHHFCLRELQSKYGYSDLCIWCDRHFHENKWNEPVLSMNNSQWLLPWMKIEISSERIWKTCICHCELDSFRIVEKLF